MKNFEFANSIYLYALLVIPVLLVVYFISVYLKKEQLKKFVSKNLQSTLIPDLSWGRRTFKYSLLLVALAAVIMAAARPRYGSKLKEVKKEGIEIIIALDVSNSMLAEDIKPNRLERAKQAIYQMIEKLNNDRIGLIVFAGDAYTQIPITTDYSSAKLFLQNVGPDMVPRQGTAVGTAIELAMKSFSPQSTASKAIIIITDGENHEGDAMQKAKEAAEAGMRVYTIGMGLSRGAPVPTSPGSKVYITDQQGNVVLSKLNKEMLAQIAAAGNGEVFMANSNKIGLAALYDKLSKLDKEIFETQEFDEYNEQYRTFIWIAFVLLIVEFLFFNRKNRLFKKLIIK